ncbi:MAG: UDP-N-acetylmuramoyl-L-alanyl-D-glutamate--2,6-diaminopimelate ligase [Rhodobacteraceae bacterium]|nr:UDP-N-acetylmuramoyl-L-alanyl-D-glutamate--2,6-diaminopimelate ligase [Paracoccaceae bacterium]
MAKVDSRCNSLTLAELGIVSATDPSLHIRGLSLASSSVRGGHLFAALPGTLTHGARFSEQAVEKGAVAILTDAEGGNIARSQLGGARCQIIVDQDPRIRLGEIAARFYSPPPPIAVAVTGTNGKTTVASMCRQLWQGLGYKAADCGTMGISGDYAAPPGLTTPDQITLHRTLACMAASGVECVALEASSHGLLQGRLAGIEFGAAAFTNLSHDHLDYHPDEASYFSAKSLLFRNHLRRSGTAVLCTDSRHGREMLRIARSLGIHTLTVGRVDADVRISRQRQSGQLQEVHFDWLGRHWRETLQLVGTHQAMNALTAAALVASASGESERTIEMLPKLATAAGRLQLVSRRDNGACIYVDYAHSPDALRAVLDGIRPHVHGRVIVVFGAGGNRDQLKRPEMGRMAARHADLAIVTDDNPRHEEASDIRRQILEGCPDAVEIGDRAEAILHAVGELGPGDTLVVAGKGHETGQIVGDSVLPFDDAEVASMAARLMDGKQT